MKGPQAFFGSPSWTRSTRVSSLSVLRAAAGGPNAAGVIRPWPRRRPSSRSPRCCLPGLARHNTQPVASSPSSGPSLSEPSAKWLATGNTTRTWPGSTGSVYFGVDLVNDTATAMVVDSVTVVTDQGQALSGAAATQVTATVAAIDLTSTTSPVFIGTGWQPPPLPAQGLPIDGHGGKSVLVVTVHPQCPGLAIPATAKIVVGYHNTTQSFTLTVNELTGADQPLTALVRQACS